MPPKATSMQPIVKNKKSRPKTKKNTAKAKTSKNNAAKAKKAALTTSNPNKAKASISIKVKGLRTPLAKRLGLKYPIFAFTRDATTAGTVSKMGGMGVLAAIGNTYDELKKLLDDTAKIADGKPFGLDVVIPEKVVGKAGDISKDQLVKMIPQEQWDFINNLLDRYRIPKLPEHVTPVDALYAWTDEVMRPQIELGFSYGIKLIANALGSPPKDIVDKAHRHNCLVAALTGNARHAQKHIQNGVDILVAQGTEAGGHCGDVTTMVLVPEIVDIAGDTPVLAAGGIGSGRQFAAAMALGAQGIWTGSIWLTAAGSSVPQPIQQKLLKATSRDTVRSKAWTGKPARQLKSPWTEAWDDPQTPEPMGMPLHWIVTGDAMQRINYYMNDPNTGAAELMGWPVGQIVGRMNKVQTAAEIFQGLVDEYEATLKRLSQL